MRHANHLPRLHRWPNLHCSLAALAVVLLAAPALAQTGGAPTAPADNSGIYVTIFRSPATGLEYRLGKFSVYGGFYPTILKTDDAVDGENTNFIRTGVAWYPRARGVSPFVAPSVVFSLDEDWEHGVLTEIGLRVPLGRRVALRGGAGILLTFDGETRVNPTIGADVRLWSR